MNLIILLASDWYLAPIVEMQNVPAYLRTCVPAFVFLHDFQNELMN